MDSLGSARREARMEQALTPGAEVSGRLYNLVLGGVLLYGLIINIVMCATMVDFALSINPILLFVGYFVLCFAGTILSAKSDNALLSFLGYNMVVIPMGLILCVVVYAYGGMSSVVVIQAFLDTCIITAMMVAAAVAFPGFFEKIGGFLFVGLVGLLITSFLQIFFFRGAVWTAYFGAALFSLYIGYDIYRSQRFAKTLDNAVDCALDVYLDIINLFLYLLRIFGKKDD